MRTRSSTPQPTTFWRSVRRRRRPPRPSHAFGSGGSARHGRAWVGAGVPEVAKGAHGYDEYLEKLAQHHMVMRAAMKTKQCVDVAAVDKLDAAIHTLSHIY